MLRLIPAAKIDHCLIKQLDPERQSLLVWPQDQTQAISVYMLYILPITLILIWQSDKETAIIKS